MPVLIVEDDAQLRKLLEALMAKKGFVAESVDRGDVALKAIVSGRYTAIILDLMLPGMTGFEILDRLHATHPHLLKRIVVLTAVSQATLRATLPHHEALWHLMRKPFDIDELIVEVKECAAFHAEQVWSSFQRRSIDGGAQAGLIATLGMTGELAVVASYGFAPELLERYFPIVSTERFPLCVAALGGRPVWLTSCAETKPLLPIWTDRKSQAIATVPLKRDETVVGAIGWSFSSPQTFDERQREYFLDLADEAVATR